LEAVLKDIEGRRADLIVCTGDLVGYCAFPNEVIDLIKGKNILTIMGNYDDAVGNELMVCGCDYPDTKDMENAAISLNWTVDITTEANKKYLRELPRELVMQLENKRIRFVHGSPRKINEYLKENSIEAEEVMADFAEDILVCGHTHKPYYRAYKDKLLVNAGSTGKPKTGNPNANYIILDIALNITAVEIIEVPYDYEKAAKAIEDNGLPEEFAELIRTGKG
jgi:putative phosphoesterase